MIFLPSFSSSFGREEVIGASALASGFLRIAGAEVFVSLSDDCLLPGTAM